MVLVAFDRHVVPDALFELGANGPVGVGFVFGGGLTVDGDETVVDHALSVVVVELRDGLEVDASPVAGDDAGDLGDRGGIFPHLLALAVALGLGAAGTSGEVVCFFIHLQLAVHEVHAFDLHLMTDGVEVRVVVVPLDLLPLGERVAKAGLAGLRVVHDAPLVHVGIVVVVELRVAEHGDEGQNDVVDDDDAGGVQPGRKVGTVVGTGKRRDGVQPVAFAALEQVGKLVSGSAVDLFLAAIGQQAFKGQRGGTTEAVADEVDLLMVSGLSPVLDETFLIGSAVTGMAILLGMDFTVVNGAAIDDGPEFAAAVPGTLPAGSRGLVDLVAAASQFFHEIAVENAQVREPFIDAVLLAPADKAVLEDSRILVADFPVGLALVTECDRAHNISPFSLSRNIGLKLS